MCNCDPNIHPDFCKVCAREMSAVTPLFECNYTSGPYYLIEKNGKQLSAAEVVEELNKVASK